MEYLVDYASYMASEPEIARQQLYGGRMFLAGAAGAGYETFKSKPTEDYRLSLHTRTISSGAILTILNWGIDHVSDILGDEPDLFRSAQIGAAFTVGRELAAWSRSGE